MAGTFPKEDIPFKQLEEFLECNVCFNAPNTGPVYQCNNGHLFCDDCNEKLSSSRCPCCRGKMSNVRSRIAEKILDKIPTGCRFKDYGCEVVLPREDLPTHSKVCKFRKIVCPDPWCYEMISLDQLSEHIKNNHWSFESTAVLKPLALGEKFNFSLPVSAKATDFGIFEFVGSSQLQFNGVFFSPQITRLLDATNTTGNWYVWIYAGLTEKECNNFICDLRISKPGSEESMSKVGPVVSLDVGRIQVIMIHFIGRIQLSLTSGSEYWTTKYWNNLNTRIFCLLS